MIKNNRNNEQIYGRNDMIMLDPNNKIYGSLGLADNYVMKTEEGTRLTLNNPKQGRFADVLTEFNIYGRSEQFSTTGVQLFNENIEIKNRGVTIKINGSTATFVGTVSDESNSRVNYQKKIKLKPGKYTASSSNEKIVANFAVKKANDKTIYNSHIEIDGTEEVRIRVLFGLKPSAKGDVINETTNIMLNDGDIAFPYEPYTGGKPSPSPDYPQEIKSVVNPVIKVRGKNLFDFSRLVSDGVNVIDYDKQTITIPAYTNNIGYNQTLRDLCPGITPGIYVFSVKRSNPDSGNGSYFLEAELDFNFNIPTELTDELLDNHIAWYNNPDSNIENVISEIQIERGTEATDYEPYYEEQTITIPCTLNAIQTGSGGNVTINGQQYIADYIDFKQGKFVKIINSLILDGDKLKFVVDSTNTYWNLPQQSAVKPIGYFILSNYFKKGVFFSNEYSNFIYTTQKNMVGLFETVDELNAFVVKKYRENDPVVLYYSMQEPIETELTLEQIEQYKKLSTKAPTTIVENNYNTWMKATYKSTESV